jgi:hypothetical protein
MVSLGQQQEEVVTSSPFRSEAPETILSSGGFSRRVVTSALAVAAVLMPGWTATECEAKTVVIVDIKLFDGQPEEDGFLSNREGHARAGLREGDVVIRGGSLTDALAQVENGDTVLIICHSRMDQGFRWQGELYRDFLPHQEDPPEGPMMLPEGFENLENVTIKLETCYSERVDPDSDDTLAQRLLWEMKEDSGNAVTGFEGTCKCCAQFEPTSFDGVPPARQQQWLDAIDHIAEYNPSWVNNPPINRDPPAATNQQTALQQTLNEQWDDPSNPARDLPVPTIRVTGYSPPVNKPVEEKCASTLQEEDCGAGCSMHHFFSDSFNQGVIPWTGCTQTFAPEIVGLECPIIILSGTESECFIDFIDTDGGVNHLYYDVVWNNCGDCWPPVSEELEGYATLASGTVLFTQYCECTGANPLVNIEWYLGDSQGRFSNRVPHTFDCECD